MLVIPLRPLPSQTISVMLNDQTCIINIYQKTYGLFIDLFINNDQLIIAGALALNATRIVRDDYLGFIGDLAFIDTQGDTQPNYQGFGGRYQFLYLESTSSRPSLLPSVFVLDKSILGGPDVLG